MAYAELLRALAGEARAEATALLDGAREEGGRIVADARRSAEALRADALASVRAEAAAEASRALGDALLERERVLLLESRRLLEDVRAEAGRRLVAGERPALARRLLDEALGDDGGDPLEILVDADDVADVTAHLARVHPRSAARARVRAAPVPRGGVEVRFGDALVVDDTIEARLARASVRLEPIVARALLGVPDGPV